MKPNGTLIFEILMMAVVVVVVVIVVVALEEITVACSN
jgi:hypothetical protein